MFMYRNNDELIAKITVNLETDLLHFNTFIYLIFYEKKKIISNLSF